MIGKPHASFFAYMDDIWGPHIIDRFADSFNTQLARFNSRFYVPGAENIDAFSTHWAGENNWLVPPLHCVVQVIQHTVASRAQGILVVPFWPPSVFWPLLFVDAYSPQPYVADYIIFPSSSDLFSLGNYKGSLLGLDKFIGQVLAVRVVA